ncbi:MAG TPA: nuclear transport factor 2 family protein [Solirubrobacteraceae bacterium]|nr:nuclear transport factor 2 family protein [Solirubrobacteraceae bacterium]
MSENLDLVRSIFAAWERGDFTAADWADPEIEFVQVDGPEPSHSTGLAGMAASFGARKNVFEHVRVEAEEVRELDDTRLLVLVRNHARAKVSGIDIERLGGARTAHVWQIRNGRVTRLAMYWDRDHALADLGLSG